MTRTRYRIFEDEYPYFMTCTVVGWLAIFTRPEAVQIVFDSWKFLSQEKGLRLYALCRPGKPSAPDRRCPGPVPCQEKLQDVHGAAHRGSAGSPRSQGPSSPASYAQTPSQS